MGRRTKVSTLDPLSRQRCDHPHRVSTHHGAVAAFPASKPKKKTHQTEMTCLLIQVLNSATAAEMRSSATPMAWPVGDEEEDSVPLVSLGRRRRIVCAASLSLAAVIAFVALSDVTAPEPSSNGAASMLVQTAGAWGNHRAMKPYTKQDLSAAETGMAAAAAALQYVKPTQTEQLSSAPISGTPSVLHRKMADVWAERPNQPRQVQIPAAVPYAGLSTISGTPSVLHHKMADVWAERPNQPRQVFPKVYAAAAVTEEQEQQEEQEKRDVQDVQEQQEQDQEQDQEQKQKQEQEEEEPSAPAPRSSATASGDATDGQAAAGQENVVAGEDEGETMRKSPLEAAVDAAEAEEASQVRARAEQQQQQQDKAWEMEEEQEEQEKQEKEEKGEEEEEEKKEEESAIYSQQPESHPLADTPRFASPPSASTPLPPYFFSSREGTHIVEQPLAPGEPYSVTGGFMQPVAETSPATEEGKQQQQQQQQPVYYPAPRRYVRITPTFSSNDEAVSDGVKPSAVTQAPSQSHGGLSSAEKAYIKKAVSDALERRRGQGSEGGWSYSPQAANGPSRWSQVGYPKCGEGARQSPINIEDGVRAAEMPTLAWQVPVESKLGGGSIVTIKDGAIELSGLEGLFSYGEAEYGLASARVHTPSEHAVGGVKLDMEVQFVHR